MHLQEVDLSKCTSNTLYSGTRKLLGKQTIHALQIQDGVLYVGGSSVDGMAGKVCYRLHSLCLSIVDKVDFAFHFTFGLNLRKHAMRLSLNHLQPCSYIILPSSLSHVC